MEANGDLIEAAAREFDLEPDAVAEAVDYVSRNRALIVAEMSEERRRAEAHVTHHAPAAR